MLFSFCKRIVGKIRREYDRLSTEVRLAQIRRKGKIPILDSLQTLYLIQNRNLSIARFGDGEFNIVFNCKGVGFQKGSEDLSARLLEVLVSDHPDLLICMPYALNSTRNLNEHAQNFYSNWSSKYYRKLSNLLQEYGVGNRLCGDANMTRPYKDWKTTAHAQAVFQEIRKLWQDQDLLIVEGRQTRLGVGNDLFDDAKSIKRILAPAVNAFDNYEEILQTVLSLHQGELILLALGPTATVLAYDLAVRGIRALDVGHIDIEYEWYLRGADSKIAIPGKYTNEVSGGDQVAECADSVYLSQIITRINEM